MLEIQPNSRQIPKSKEICANKKYNDILYAYLQNESVMEKISGKRFFSKKAVNFSKGKSARYDLEPLCEKYGFQVLTNRCGFDIIKMKRKTSL